jgi:protoporphyrinogen/coproporphyrinogen III oxidase
MDRPARVVVVGGGITGLVAAYRLTRNRDGAAPVHVTLVESAPRLGGKVRTGEAGGFLVETGPDSFVVRKPWAVDLATELGLGPDLIVPGASGAFVWARGRLIRFPTGTAFGVPTEVETVLRWPGLSLRGKLSASLDLWRRAPSAKPDPDDDETLGGLLDRRLGHEAAAVLAGPVLAGIHAGDPARMSVAATFPELRAWERGAGSLIRGARAASKTARKQSGRSGSEAAGAASPHLFTTIDGGLDRLVDALATRLGVADVLTGTPVERIERGAHGGHAVVGGGGRIPADAVILATPAAVAAEALAPVAPASAASLRELRAVSTATVTLVYPPGSAERLPDATGVLVPARADAERVSGARAPSGPSVVTACTWISRKWPDASFDDRAVVRCFVGRDGEQAPLDLDDDALAGAVAADIERMTPLGTGPQSTLVTRWPDGMPQYDVGHLGRVAAAEEALGAEAPGVFLAGAPYGGIGIADCVRQGNEAADRVRAHLRGTNAPAPDGNEPTTTRS